MRVTELFVRLPTSANAVCTSSVSAVDNVQRIATGVKRQPAANKIFIEMNDLYY
jgi:hypothetical protein